MNTIQNIKINNHKLGIKTIFYNANDDILGYSDNKKIYLNTFYNEDIELVNKHETLHFFSDTKQFKIIKNLIFSILSKEQLDKIRSQYYLKYLPLYSYDKLENGALDEEIAIDIIVHNGDFPINIDEYVKDAYQTIVENVKQITFSNKTRKYLNISLSKKIDQQFPKLTKWEKLFVLNYYNGKDKILPHDKLSKHEEVRRHITNELKKLYEYGERYSNFVVDYKSKEIKRKVEMQIKKLILEGDEESAQLIQNNIEQNLKEMANMVSNNLQKEYQSICEILKTSEYDEAFKYLMLTETLNRTYKKEKVEDKLLTLIDKRVEHESISSHMTLNPLVLDMIYNNIDKYDRFIDLYFESLEDFNELVKKENSINLEGINTFNKGKWLKFEGKKSDEKNFINNAQKLTALVKDTVWCTKNQATMHLEKGDYYVFVDNEGNPHIAIRMIGTEISEVRGIENGNAQEIEEEYREVVMEFLSKNVKIKYGKEWLEKEEWNKRLIKYINKLKNDTITEKDIDELIYDITEINDYKIHHHKNKNKEILLDIIKKDYRILDKIAEKYNCKVSEICFAPILFNESNMFPYKVIIGDVLFNKNNDNIDFSKLTYILGDVRFNNSTINELPSLRYVSGDLELNTSLIKDLPTLKKVGGELSTWGSKIEKINSLKEVGGELFCYYSDIKEMKNLEKIGGNANFSLSKIEKLPKLQKVDGLLNIRNTSIKSLQSLLVVEGNADFSNSQLEKINPNCKIKGKLNFVNSPLEHEMLKK